MSGARRRRGEDSTLVDRDRDHDDDDDENERERRKKKKRSNAFATKEKNEEIGRARDARRRDDDLARAKSSKLCLYSARYEVYSSALAHGNGSDPDMLESPPRS